MFEVAIHGYGRKIIRQGPCAGLLEWPKHQWITIGKTRGRKAAEEMARAQECRAVVIRAFTSTVLFDNGKAPRVPEGWLPADAETILDER